MYDIHAKKFEPAHWPPQLYVLIGRQCDTIRDTWHLTSTCRSAAQARHHPALYAAHVAQASDTPLLTAFRSCPPTLELSGVIDSIIEDGNGTDLNLVCTDDRNPMPGCTCLSELKAEDGMHDCPALGPMTPLLAAVLRNMPAVVRRLIRAGAQPDGGLDRPGQMSALAWACHRGYHVCVEALLQRGASLNRRVDLTVDAFVVGRRHQLQVAEVPPVCAAARYGHLPVVQRLLGAGVRVDTGWTGQEPLGPEKQAEGAQLTQDAGDPPVTLVQSDCPPFVSACRGGHLECAEWLLQAGADVHAHDTSGLTPLGAAALSGNVQLVKKLISLGACPFKGRFDGGERVSVLHLAAGSRHGTAELVQLLLELPDATDDWLVHTAHGRTPLMAAAESGKFAVLHPLVQAGCSLTATDAYGSTALHHAVHGCNTVLATALAICQGSGVHELDSGGLAPIHWACEYGFSDIVQVLAVAGGLNVRGGRGQTPLISAAASGHLSAASLLLSLECSIDAADVDGYTALHVAAKAGDADMVRLLLQARISPVARTNSGATPLFFAIQHTDAALVLIEAKAFDGVDTPRSGDPMEATLLHLAASLGLVSVTNALLAAGADVNKPDNSGATSVFFASHNGCLDVVQALLDAGAHADVELENGSTALWWAMEKDHADVMALLLRAGCSTSRIDAEGLSMLSTAARRGHTDAVKVLLAAGADLHVACPRGMSALHYAAEGDIKEHTRPVVAVLLEAGARYNVTCKLGRTPLMHAVTRVRPHGSCSKLLAAGADPLIIDINGMTASALAALAGHEECAGILRQFEHLHREEKEWEEARWQQVQARRKQQREKRKQQQQQLRNYMQQLKKAKGWSLRKLKVHVAVTPAVSTVAPES